MTAGKGRANTVPKVRKAKEEDLLACVDIDKRCFREDNMDILQAWEARNNIYVLERKKKILGFYWVEFKGNNAYLASLDIDKPYRGKGYSRILMNHYLSLKKPVFSLHVKYNNRKAIKLYKSLGFIQRYIEEDFYGDGSSAIFMVKKA